MIHPLDPRTLSAFFRGRENSDSLYLDSAKQCLNEDRNLSQGVWMLLQLHGRFQPRLYIKEEDVAMDDEIEGAKIWHVRFRDPPFSNLRVYPTRKKGVVEIRVKKKPMVSLELFDRPHNWQAMFEWLWQYGDQFEIARSIPQLDPQKLSQMFDMPENHDAHQVEGETLINPEKCMGDKMLYLFSTFDDLFKPRIKLDRNVNGDQEKEGQKWDIVFQKSPFRSLRIQPSARDGAVDVFGFDKLVESFEMNDGLHIWKALLDCIWDYGNKRHIAKNEYKASHPQLKAEMKTRNKFKRNSKPLLHQVLRTAGFKKQRESMMPPKQLSNISEEWDVSINVATTAMPVQRQPLVPANPNKQTGKSSPLKDQDGI